MEKETNVRNRCKIAIIALLGCVAALSYKLWDTCHRFERVNDMAALLSLTLDSIQKEIPSGDLKNAKGLAVTSLEASLEMKTQLNLNGEGWDRFDYFQKKPPAKSVLPNQRD